MNQDIQKTVVYFTDSQGFGGTEQVLLQLLAGIDRRRWRPVLFYHREPGLEPLLKKARQLKVHLRTVPRIDTIRDIGKLPKFIRILRSERPSVLHAHLTWPLSCKYGLLAAGLARVPAIVATAHSNIELSRWLSKIQPKLIAMIVDRFTAVSQAIADHLCNAFKISATKVHRIHNGIHLRDFDRRPIFDLRALLNTDFGQHIILSVGRLEPLKGQKYLIEAAVKLPTSAFVFVGDGPDREALEAQARALGVDDRVFFLGYREDVPNLLAGCDLFVLPSFVEGLPLSILEAMAAGKPVIASAIGGNSEAVVHRETGLLIPSGDASALVDAITTLLNDPNYSRMLALAGQERVNRHFSVDVMVENTMRIYEEILAAPGASRGAEGQLSEIGMR